MKNIEIGLVSFVEATNNNISHYDRIHNVLKEIKLADNVGLDFFGIGEHHRKDYAASSPIAILSSAATITNNIKLGSAVSVLSSDDPIRLLEQFNTLNIISNNRAELMVGRGSFIESFPLFGYNLEDYEILFEEKLDLLVKLNNNKNVSWTGQTRLPLENANIYPEYDKDLKISIGVGGTTQSVVRAAKYGLPLVLAIIGGNPLYFKRFVDLYKKLYVEYGHPIEKMQVTATFHGFISENENDINHFKEANIFQMNQIAKERGWHNYDEKSYERDISMNGALIVGNPNQVIDKMNYLIKELDLDRILLQLTVGSIPIDVTLNAIKLLGEKVKPNLIRK